MTEIGIRESPLRVLAFQTSSLLTSEVQVLHTLLENLGQLGQRQDIGVEFLLVQGIDDHASVGSGREVADLFRRIPHVAIHEISVGKLGRHDTSASDRVLKLRDLLHLQFARTRLPALARSFRPHLVYSNQQTWDVRMATPLARWLECPQVVHLHYIVGPWLGRGTVDTLKKADMLIAVSDFIRVDAMEKGVEENRTRVLYNSISVPRAQSAGERRQVKRRLCSELSIPEDSVLVGMTARVNPYKGQEELTQAMLPILREDWRVHLILAGGENPTGLGIPERIRQRAQTYHVDRRVHLLGQRSDVPRILDALDIFGHPSRHDPCPLAVLEAAAHGLPIVAWREGGPAALIADGETGLLVEPMDIRGLTCALRTLIADEYTRAAMGRNGRERAIRMFRPDVAAASFLSLLQQAVFGTADPIRSLEYRPVLR